MIIHRQLSIWFHCLTLPLLHCHRLHQLYSLAIHVSTSIFSIAKYNIHFQTSYQYSFQTRFNSALGIDEGYTFRNASLIRDGVRSRIDTIDGLLQICRYAAYFVGNIFAALAPNTINVCIRPTRRVSIDSI